MPTLTRRMFLALVAAAPIAGIVACNPVGRVEIWEIADVVGVDRETRTRLIGRKWRVSLPPVAN